MSDIEPPSRKRMFENGPSITDGLAIGMISISACVRVRLSNEIMNSLNKFPITDQATIAPLGNEKNIFSGYSTAPLLGDMTTKNGLKEIDDTSECGQPLSAPASVISKASGQSGNSSVTGIKRAFPFSAATSSKIRKNSTCIWPTGISCQADFTEIVVSDVEMNAFWDTLEGIF